MLVMLIMRLPAVLLLVIMISMVFLNLCRRSHQCLNRFLAYGLKLSWSSITSAALGFGSQNCACIMLVVLLLCALLMLELLVLFLFVCSIHSSGLIIMNCDLAIATIDLICFWREHRLWSVCLWRRIILLDELLMSDAGTATLNTSPRRMRRLLSQSLDHCSVLHVVTICGGCGSKTLRLLLLLLWLACLLSTALGSSILPILIKLVTAHSSCHRLGCERLRLDRWHGHLALLYTSFGKFGLI